MESAQDNDRRSSEDNRQGIEAQAIPSDDPMKPQTVRVVSYKEFLYPWLKEDTGELEKIVMERYNDEINFVFGP